MNRASKKGRRSPWLKIRRELKRVRKQLKWSTVATALVSAKRNIDYQLALGPRANAAREAYWASPVSRLADTFMLVRIIGNDLEPRHRKGQSFDNALFILNNEPACEGCEKFWIVNRIVDADEEARIIGPRPARNREHALRLAELLRPLGPLGAHVNLIPLNQTQDFAGHAPVMDQIRDFADLLYDHGLNATVRRNRGTDIDAACGQLRERATVVVPDPSVRLPE